MSWFSLFLIVFCAFLAVNTLGFLFRTYLEILTARRKRAKFEEMRAALQWVGEEAVALKERRLNKEEK